LTGWRAGFVPLGSCVGRIGGEIGGHLQHEAPGGVAVCFGERGGRGAEGSEEVNG
jgi:hypothetical protein